MSEFLKPQSPLQHKDGAFIYPLTTADQVILEDNNRLNFALEHLAYVSEQNQEDDITNLFTDKAMTIPAFPRTKVKAISDDNGIDLNTILEAKSDINHTHMASDIGALSMELLWENASPTSWFTDQTISVDLSKYSMCCIEYNGNVGDTNMHVCFVPIGYMTWLHSEWNFRCVREANIKTNSIVFGKGMHSQFNEALADYNGVCVPIKIYGIKGVSA